MDASKDAVVGSCVDAAPGTPDQQASVHLMPLVLPRRVALFWAARSPTSTPDVAGRGRCKSTTTDGCARRHPRGQSYCNSSGADPSPPYEVLLGICCDAGLLTPHAALRGDTPFKSTASRYIVAIMVSDGQGFLDSLSNLPSDMGSSVERAFDHAAGALRRAVHTSGDALSTVVWVPAQLRTPAPPPPARMAPLSVLPLSYLGCARRWIAEHPALVAALVGFFGSGSLLLYQQRKSYMRKRRAKRAANGARREVVVVAGTPNTAVARSVILNLERRGFIVYVVCASAAEEEIVKSEERPDILPLHLNVADPLDVANSIKHFSRLFTSAHTSGSGATALGLLFTGLILIPDVGYAAGPIETISPELWWDALNAKVLGSVAMTQAFLRPIADMKARILVLTPNIVASLKPAFHSVESTIVGALDSFVACLRAEMNTLGVQVCQIQLGNFDANGAGERSAVQRSWRADILSWQSAAREAYAENYLSLQEEDRGRGLLAPQRRQLGSPLRSLNNDVFDALTVQRPWTVMRSGQGSVLYSVIGRVAPAGLVGWMIGLRRKRDERELSS